MRRNNNNKKVNYNKNKIFSKQIKFKTNKSIILKIFRNKKKYNKNNLVINNNKYKQIQVILNKLKIKIYLKQEKY